jgi:hypothetical protein
LKIGTIAALFLALSVVPAQALNPQADSKKPTAQQPPAAPSAQPAGQAKIDSAKEADIRRLLEVTGVKALATQTIDSMQKSIKPLLANSLPPGEYREKLIDLFFERFSSKADLQHLLDLAVPIYDKYLSHEEIKGLIQFYETPLGRKTISVLPALSEELRTEGEKWGQGLGRESMREVLAEHPDLAAALEAASKKAP